MSRRALLTLLTSAGIGLTSGVVVSMSRSAGFPHEAHAGLFPTCLGCHAGIPEGDEDRYFSVEPRDCIRCHDGERGETVDWTAPTRTASNLKFVHVRHMEAVDTAGDEDLGCAECHGPTQPDQPRMAIARAAPEICVSCHAHEVPEHLAGEAVCATCHATLAEVPELSVTRVAEFPQPPTHAAESFIVSHGEMAEAQLESCAVCHARESCTRCHLNAEGLDVIRSLAPDQRIAELVAGRAGAWPEPESHGEQGWEFSHAERVVGGSQSCASCHAEPSCRTCHGEANIPQITALPDSSRVGLAGVTVPRTRAPGHIPDFASQHGAAAAANLPNCTSCHVERECAACHEAVPTRSAQGNAPVSFEPPRSGYHPASFVLRHGAEAFAVQSSCADCHSTEAFCRSCHQNVGVAVGVADGAGGAFHDAQPDWLFEHGRAARQGLEACTSCHQQTSCLRCHSAKSGLRISPHGPDFDPDRAADASLQSCAICHTARQILP